MLLRAVSLIPCRTLSLATTRHLREMHEEIAVLQRLNERGFDKVEQKLQTMQETVGRAEAEHSRKAVFTWLSQVDPSTNYSSAQKSLQQKASNGNWFFQSSEFKQWMDGNRACLWLKGSCKP
jgi:hypothetical protein